MQDELPQQEKLKRYVLGTLADDEVEQFELKYFSDAERLNELWVLCDEMIDDWVRGELPPALKEQLQSRLRVLPALRERSEFARTLHAALTQPVTVRSE